MCGVVAYIILSFNAVQSSDDDVVTNFPLNVVPFPAMPTHRSFNTH